jgi:pimeloyl-ACP methyl ester carboxylesterase
MRIPLVDFGGHGAVVHVAPANGFPLETYGPIVERLTAHHRVVAVPPRALWDGAPPPPPEPGSWESIGEDIVAGLGDHGIDGAILLGHSFGGIASLVAAARHPDMVRALGLLDPTLLPPSIALRFRIGRESSWQAATHPLAVAARERRSRFASRSEAFAYWRDRPLFADWSDRALDRYVDGMLRPEPDNGFGLRWAPAWEAYYYESIYLDAWDDVADLDPTLPVLVIAGGTSTAFEAGERERFRQAIPWAEMEVVPGHGHLFPQSAPHDTAALIEAWLARVRSGSGSGTS